MNRIKRAFEAFLHKPPAVLLAIPPGQSYYCNSCGWTCHGTDHGHCKKCAAVAVISVHSIMAVLREPVKMRLRRRNGDDLPPAA